MIYDVQKLFAIKILFAL